MNESKRYPFVVLIILNYNGEEILERCLNSLLETNYPNFKIVVVDNGSTDNSVKIIHKYFKGKVDLIVNKKNLGFSKGMNIGIKYALKEYNPEFIGLLNNDLFFHDKKWLVKIIDVMENNTSIAIASPTLIFPNGELQQVGKEKIKSDLLSLVRLFTPLLEKEYNHLSKSQVLIEVDVLFGPCVIIRRGILDKVGLLDERYTPFLFEDVEYSLRIKKHGYKSVIVRNSKVIHLVSYTMRKILKNDKEKDLYKTYVFARNALLLSLEYFGLFKTSLIALPLITFHTLFERKNKRQNYSLSNIHLRENLRKRLKYLVRAFINAMEISNPSRYLK
jgi:hypothetical protein